MMRMIVFFASSFAIIICMKHPFTTGFVFVQPNLLSIRPRSPSAPDLCRLETPSWRTSTAATGGSTGSGIRTEENESLVSSIADSVSVSTLDDQFVSLTQIIQGDSPVVLSCLSHFGDFNAWELTQQYVTSLQEGGRLASSDCKVVLVGIGSVASARQFAQDLELEGLSDRLTLVADPTGQVSEALGCYRGWLAVDKVHRERYPQTDMNPLLKLLGMIFGLGSPGTIEKVVYGYTGDMLSEKGVDGRNWVVQSLLQGSGRGRLPSLTVQAFESTPISSCLRPFELATLRLQTGLHIVQNWSKLGAQGDLVTSMGGTFVLDTSMACKWSYFDKGILTYADVDEVSEVVQAISQGDEYVPWTKEQKTALNKQRTEALVQRKQQEPSLPGRQNENENATVEAMPEVKFGSPSFFAYPVEDDDAAGDPVEEATKSIPTFPPEDELPSHIDDNMDSLDAVDESVQLEIEDDSLALDEAIIRELDEERMKEMGGAAMIDSSDDEGAFLADFEDEIDLIDLESERVRIMGKAKDLLHRSLLQAQFEYASRKGIVAIRGEPASNADQTDNAGTVGPSKERFQRSLLSARYNYLKR